jgi:hypothetical protein
MYSTLFWLHFSIGIMVFHMSEIPITYSRSLDLEAAWKSDSTVDARVNGSFSCM